MLPLWPGHFSLSPTSTQQRNIECVLEAPKPKANPCVFYTQRQSLEYSDFSAKQMPLPSRLLSLEQLMLKDSYLSRQISSGLVLRVPWNSRMVFTGFLFSAQRKPFSSAYFLQMILFWIRYSFFILATVKRACTSLNYWVAALTSKSQMSSFCGCHSLGYQNFSTFILLRDMLMSCSQRLAVLQLRARTCMTFVAKLQTSSVYQSSSIDALMSQMLDRLTDAKSLKLISLVTTLAAIKLLISILALLNAQRVSQQQQYQTSEILQLQKAWISFWLTPALMITSSLLRVLSQPEKRLICLPAVRSISQTPSESAQTQLGLGLLMHLMILLAQLCGISYLAPLMVNSTDLGRISMANSLWLWLWMMIFLLALLNWCDSCMMLRSSLSRMTLLQPLSFAARILLLPLQEQQNLFWPSVTKQIVFTQSFSFMRLPFTQGEMFSYFQMSVAAPYQMIIIVGSIDEYWLFSSNYFMIVLTKTSLLFRGIMKIMWFAVFPLELRASFSSSFTGLLGLRQKTYSRSVSLKLMSLLCWCFAQFLNVFRKWFLNSSASLMLLSAKTEPNGAQSRLLDLTMTMLFLLKFSASLERKILQATSFLSTLISISALSLMVLKRSLASNISPSFFLRIWQYLIFCLLISAMYSSNFLARDSSRYSRPMILTLLQSETQLNLTSEYSFWMSASWKRSSSLLAMILSWTLSSFSPILFCAVKMLLSSFWSSSAMNLLVTYLKDRSFFSTTTHIFSIFSQVNLSMSELNLYSLVRMSLLSFYDICSRTMLLKFYWFQNFTFTVTITSGYGNWMDQKAQLFLQFWPISFATYSRIISFIFGWLWVYWATEWILTAISSLLSSLGSFLSAYRISFSFSTTKFLRPTRQKSSKYSELAIFFSKVYFFSMTCRHIWFQGHLGDLQPVMNCTVSTSSLVENLCTMLSLYFQFLRFTVTILRNFRQTSISLRIYYQFWAYVLKSCTLQVEITSSLYGSLTALVLMLDERSALVLNHCSKAFISNSACQNSYSLTSSCASLLDLVSSSLFSSFFLYLLFLLWATLTLSSSKGYSLNWLRLWTTTSERVSLACWQQLGSCSSQTISMSSEELEARDQLTAGILLQSPLMSLWMASMLCCSIAFSTLTRNRFSVAILCCNFLASSCILQLSTMHLTASSSTFFLQILILYCLGSSNSSSSMSTSPMFLTTFMEYSSISAFMALMSSSQPFCGPLSSFSSGRMVIFGFLQGRILKRTSRRYQLKVYWNLNSLVLSVAETRDSRSLIWRAEWLRLVLVVSVILMVEGMELMLMVREELLSSASSLRLYFFLPGLLSILETIKQCYGGAAAAACFLFMQGQHSDYYLVYLRVNGCYFWFNVFQILASVLLIVLLLQERYHLAAIVEIFIAFLVALDLIIRYFTEGPPQFAKSWDNRINLLILLLLAVSITSDIVAPDVTHHDGGIVASLFLFARYLLQSVRLCRLLSESRKALEVSSHQTISLGELGEEESGESSH